MEKTYISTQKYLIQTPRKVREVVGLVKKLTPVKALDQLMFIPKRAAEFLAKVIKTAMAQARLAGESDENLIFKEIQIGEGPRLKRGRAASRGRWHPYKKRMSHIRVVLTTKPVAKVKVEEVKKGTKKKNGTKS